MTALYCYKQQLSSVIMYQKSANTFIAVVHLTINFFANYQHLVVVFTAALPSTHYYWHISQIISTFKGELWLSKCNCILVSSYPLSPPFSFDHNYTCRRVKWGEHGMGPMQHWLTTATPFKSQKILFKARALGSNLKYISASNIRPVLHSCMTLLHFSPVLPPLMGFLPHPPTPHPPELREVLRYTYF